MSENNGYVIHADGGIVGPFLSYADAVRAIDKSKPKSVLISPLKAANGVVRVFDCDRSECRHCRDMERESLYNLNNIGAPAE